MSDNPHQPLYQSEEQLPELTSDARNWAMLCHLSALAGLIAPGVAMFIGPLVVWLLKRNDHPFIDDQGKEALNFQISMLIYVVLLCCIVIGIPIAILLVVVNIVFVVIAAVKSNGGVVYRYPMTLRLIH
ncbi:MAG: DUF4870 domain-containing protein [Pirellulales bacterium]